MDRVASLCGAEAGDPGGGVAEDADAVGRYGRHGRHARSLFGFPDGFGGTGYEAQCQPGAAVAGDGEGDAGEGEAYAYGGGGRFFRRGPLEYLLNAATRPAKHIR